MNTLSSLFNAIQPGPVLALILFAAGLVWSICAFAAVILLPFVLFRFFRALALFNRAHEREWLFASSQRHEPKFQTEGERTENVGKT